MGYFDKVSKAATNVVSKTNQVVGGVNQATTSLSAITQSASAIRSSALNGMTNVGTGVTGALAGVAGAGVEGAVASPAAGAGGTDGSRIRGEFGATGLATVAGWLGVP